MQQRQTRLPELPEFGGDDMLFTLKDITYTPTAPRKKEPFTVRGKVELFGIPYVLPIWVVAKVTYPEEWWEEIIPIWGSPTVGEGQTALGGDFEIKFPRGFDREGEFALDVEVHLGPTFTVDSITLPPFPPMASQAMTFIVAGEVPPEEAGFRNFRILSYSKNGGPPVMPPGVLELEVGDRCRVNVGFDHRDGAVTAEFHAAIWQDTPLDPHDEVLDAEKTFSVPSSVDWESWEGSIDIIITSAISPGSEYGLYVKIMGITGGDIFTPYLANVITIVGPPPVADIRNFDFQLTGGTYNVGDAVLWAAPYEYVGPAQSGRLTISIGTGIYPTFNPVHTYAPVTINFEEALSWTARALQGNITLPSTLQPGQTYSVRAKLETTTYPTQETDTDWSAFDVTPIGPPTSDIRNFEFRAEAGTYDLGDRVDYTAPYEYKGKAQGGWLTISLGAGVYPSFSTKYTYPRKAVTFNEAMDWASRQLSGSFTLPTTLEPGQTYSVRAKLETADGKQETDTDWSAFDITEVETRTLEIDITPVGSGYVTTSPAPIDIENHWIDDTRGKFEVGTRVRVTAHPNSGYRFDYWSDEIQGGTSTLNPEWVSDNGYMYDNKAVKAHFREEEVPEKEPPEVDTLDARDIIHDTARLRGELVDTGYWNVVDCYFQWGKTTSYGKTTPKVRMYEGDEGETFYTELLHQLEPDTTYHFRAVAVTVGINGELKGYGPDKSFTTEKEVVKGFTMRVINARAGSVYWRAACVAGGGLPSTPSLKLDQVWVWTGAVPDYTLDFFVWSGDADKKTTQYDEFPFRLLPGKNYVWDFAAHEMREV